MKSSLDVTGLKVKVDNNFGGILISQEEYICIMRDMGRVYGKGKGTRIFVG